MKESSNNKRILKLVFGCLFIGGVAAIIGIYRIAQHTESPVYFV